MNKSQDLIDFKNKIERSEQTKIEKEAELKAQMNVLKEEHEIDTIEDAEKLLESLEGKKDKLQNAVNEKMEDMEKEYM